MEPLWSYCQYKALLIKASNLSNLRVPFLKSKLERDLSNNLKTYFKCIYVLSHSHIVVFVCIIDDKNKK